MKTKLTTIGSLTILCLAAFSARAGIILSDDFTYPDGSITNVSSGKWAIHSGNNDFNIVSGAAQVNAGVSSALNTGDVNATLTNAPYATNGPVAALYAKFTINVATLPSGAGTYFAHFKDTGTANFRARIFVSTNGAASGSYRIGVANAGSTQTNITTDLSPGTTYTVVVRYVLSTGRSTLWLNPTAETSPGLTATDTPSLLNISTYAFRQSTGAGTINIDNLLVGTTFADVVPTSAGSNPPFIVTQPADVPSTTEGSTASFTALAVGDPTLGYQWFYNTNQSPAWLQTNASATNTTLVLSNTTVAESGTYDCVITNLSGSVTTRYAVLGVSSTPIPPGITNQPQSQAVTVGDTATFTVIAGGSQPLTYYWKSIIGVVTNVEATTVGGTNSTLTLTSVGTNRNGSQYFVTVSNQFGSTNSALATLTVNPPALTNIAYLRSTEDTVNWVPTNTTSVFRVRGIVTTWNDMTGSGSCSFFIQDATAGINVFWNGAAAATYLPPAGAFVEVTGPLANFGGLLELSPVFGNALHGVTVLSTGNPLPAPRPLPFDPAVINNPTNMEALEGSYVVASNVFLDLDTGAIFASGSTDPVTNAFNLSQTFVMYVNTYIDIAGKPKYSGPVTIYGVLGQHVTTTPATGGYQLTPSRYADIVPPVRWTNVLENLTRRGDQPTNSFSETVLRPGEKLIMDVLAIDPAGSGVTSIGSFTGMPPGASGTTGLSAGTGTGHFVYQATSAAAGSNYAVSLVVTAPTWTATNVWTIYVPTNYEQQIYISEFLAFASANSNSPAFNPLKRAADTNNFGNDRYVEIANLSGTTVDLLNWTLGGNQSTWHTFYNGSPSETLGSSNIFVVYGGPLSIAINPPTILGGPGVGPIEAATGTIGLGASGAVITLHNQDGHLVDRIVYTSSDLSTNNDSNSRFPTLNDAPVPQSYISTNWVTPGLQYNGGAWTLPTKAPASVTNIVVTAGSPLTLSFTANTSLATTLWQANNITDRFRVVYGQQFTNTGGVFQILNAPPAQQFYFITTQ